MYMASLQLPLMNALQILPMLFCCAITTHLVLQDMFSRSGEVLRLVLPPTHVLALVEFQEASAARAAFASLAYRRLRGWPMYLEWAPASIWGGPLKVHTPALTCHPSPLTLLPACVCLHAVREGPGLQASSAISVRHTSDPLVLMNMQS